MYKETIGIIGGFGAYATLNFYKRILEEFAGNTERDYPHIYMDNDFTMPSRTRALLNGRKGDYFEIVKMISKSMVRMCEWGADYIVMVCGTAHAFLSDVLEQVPEAEDKVVDIIELLRDELLKREKRSALVLAAEGALESGVYPNKLPEIDCIIPSKEYYGEIRYYIESVKNNRLNERILKDWDAFIGNFIEKYRIEDVILGCTELPVLVSKCFSNDTINYIDPLELTIRKLKECMR